MADEPVLPGVLWSEGFFPPSALSQHGIGEVSATGGGAGNREAVCGIGGAAWEVGGREDGVGGYDGAGESYHLSNGQ